MHAILQARGAGLCEEITTCQNRANQGQTSTRRETRAHLLRKRASETDSFCPIAGLKRSSPQRDPRAHLLRRRASETDSFCPIAGSKRSSPQRDPLPKHWASPQPVRIESVAIPGSLGAIDVLPRLPISTIRTPVAPPLNDRARFRAIPPTERTESNTMRRRLILRRRGGSFPAVRLRAAFPRRN